MTTQIRLIRGSRATEIWQGKISKGHLLRQTINIIEIQLTYHHRQIYLDSINNKIMARIKEEAVLEIRIAEQFLHSKVRGMSSQLQILIGNEHLIK